MPQPLQPEAGCRLNLIRQKAAHRASHNISAAHHILIFLFFPPALNFCFFELTWVCKPNWKHLPKIKNQHYISRQRCITTRRAKILHLYQKHGRESKKKFLKSSLTHTRACMRTHTHTLFQITCH